MSTLSTKLEVPQVLYDNKLNKTFTDSRVVYVSMDVHDVNDPESLVIAIGANNMSLSSLEQIVADAKRLLLAREAFAGSPETAPQSKPEIKRYAVQVDVEGNGVLRTHYVRAYDCNDAHECILKLFPDCEISHSFLVDDNGDAL